MARKKQDPDMLIGIPGSVLSEGVVYSDAHTHTYIVSDTHNIQYMHDSYLRYFEINLLEGVSVLNSLFSFCDAVAVHKLAVLLSRWKACRMRATLSRRPVCKKYPAETSSAKQVCDWRGGVLVGIWDLLGRNENEAVESVSHFGSWWNARLQLKRL